MCRCKSHCGIIRRTDDAAALAAPLAQIQRERKDYCDQLEATQKGPLDVTPWLSWFLGCLLRAVQAGGRGAQYGIRVV
jgi:Fic family protein